MSLATDWIKGDFFKVGKLTKVHGIQGAMVLRMDKKVEDIVAVPQWAFVSIEGGLVPLKIRKNDTFLKDSQHLVVALEEFGTPGEVARFLNCVVHFEGIPEDCFNLKEEKQNDLIGYRVFDEESKKEGVVVDYLDIQSNPLLEGEFDGKKILIPEQPTFIISVDNEQQRIVVNIPPGLWNLQ